MSIEKLHYLKRYVAGAAKETIEGYFMLKTSDAYKTARATLKNRFGNAYTVAEASREKLDQWSKIGSKDSVGLRKFGDFLQKCLAAMPTVPELNIFHDSRENKNLTHKLSDWLANRWIREITDKQKAGQFPSFQDFAKFVADEAEISCNPFHAPPPKPLEKYKGSHNNSFIFVKDKRVTLQTQGREKNQPDSCKYCRLSNHKIAECRSLRKLEGERQVEFVKSNSLCFGCLKPNHKSKDCSAKATCKRLEQKHPTALHRERKTTVTKTNWAQEPTETNHQRSEGQASTLECSSKINIF
ncbi:uncharacterized protein [Watersipora subatra]|uniref:uncharacterized protein n=1 Tax=Watersipora subatra TaxID=2589382 RepID=UPI00355C0093